MEKIKVMFERVKTTARDLYKIKEIIGGVVVAVGIITCFAVTTSATTTMVGLVIAAIGTALAIGLPEVVDAVAPTVPKSDSAEPTETTSKES